jgi:tetratricopeptide (TPR) repeat protein
MLTERDPLSALSPECRDRLHLVKVKQNVDFSCGVDVMSNRDSAPVLLRLKRLEQKVEASSKKRSPSFFTDPSKLISISAFIISIATTFYSWRKENVESQIAQRRQLDSTIQQMIDGGIKNFEFGVRNENRPNVGAMSGWFNAQIALSAQKAAQELALSGTGTITDYIMVGNALLDANEFSRAGAAFQRAVQIGQEKQAAEKGSLYHLVKSFRELIFGEGLDQTVSDEQRPHELTTAHAALAASLIARNNPEGAQIQYEAGLRVIEASNYPDIYKQQLRAYVYKLWGGALWRFKLDCNGAKAQLETAARLHPNSLKVQNNDWNSIQYELGVLVANCGSDGRRRDIWSGPSAATTQNVVTCPQPAAGPEAGSVLSPVSPGNPLRTPSVAPKASRQKAARQ